MDVTAHLPNDPAMEIRAGVFRPDWSVVTKPQSDLKRSKISFGERSCGSMPTADGRRCWLISSMQSASPRTA